MTQHLELIKILLSKELVVQDWNFLSELESILQNLKDDDQIDMMKQLLDVLRVILTEADYRDLSIKFREL